MPDKPAGWTRYRLLKRRAGTSDRQERSAWNDGTKVVPRSTPPFEGWSAFSFFFAATRCQEK
ncbi:hypothetical protein M2243_000570 [Heliophilum fasciatum]|nr:hypothetical protein [Heliophilum fasciatum]